MRATVRLSRCVLEFCKVVPTPYRRGYVTDPDTSERFGVAEVRYHRRRRRLFVLVEDAKAADLFGDDGLAVLLWYATRGWRLAHVVPPASSCRISA